MLCLFGFSFFELQCFKNDHWGTEWGYYELFEVHKRCSDQPSHVSK
jgi:hypothetical protein